MKNIILIFTLFTALNSCINAQYLSYENKLFLYDGNAYSLEDLADKLTMTEREYNLYESIVNKDKYLNNWNSLLWVSGSTTAFGIALMSWGEGYLWSTADPTPFGTSLLHIDESGLGGLLLSITGAIITMASVPVFITSTIGVLISGSRKRKTIQTFLSSYNNNIEIGDSGGNSLRIGLTQHGIGLTYNF